MDGQPANSEAINLTSVLIVAGCHASHRDQRPPNVGISGGRLPNPNTPAQQQSASNSTLPNSDLQHRVRLQWWWFKQGAHKGRPYAI